MCPRRPDAVGAANHDRASWTDGLGKERFLAPSNHGAAQQGLPLGTAALVAGVGLLLMVVSAPFAQLFVFAVAGLAYVVTELGRLVAPDVSLDFLLVTGLAEPVFMIWLLVKGRHL